MWILGGGGCGDDNDSNDRHHHQIKLLISDVLTKVEEAETKD
jgi:hypothetical protein